MSDRDNERWYPNPWKPGADPFPSVTTILERVAGKPGLLKWRSREAARYAVGNIDGGRYGEAVGVDEYSPTLDELLADGRYTDAVEWVAAEPDRIAERAADLGKLLHRLAEAEVKGEPATMTDEEAKAIAPYMDAFHLFLDEMKPTFHWAEATVYHKWARYAGTTDGGATFARPIPVINSRGELFDTFEPGTLLNVDYKTGRRVWPEAVPQQVAYSTATHMGIRDGIGTVVPMPRVAGAVVVHIRPDGYRVHGVRVTPSARAAWEHAVGWYHWLHHLAAEDLGVGVRAELTVEDLPGIDVRVRNGLALAGVRTLADLEAMGEAAFLAVKHAGPAAAVKARRLLALEGRSWPATTEIKNQKGAA